MPVWVICMPSTRYQLFSRRWPRKFTFRTVAVLLKGAPGHTVLPLPRERQLHNFICYDSIHWITVDLPCTQWHAVTCLCWWDCDATGSEPETAVETVCHVGFLIKQSTISTSVCVFCYVRGKCKWSFDSSCRMVLSIELFIHSFMLWYNDCAWQLITVLLRLRCTFARSCK